MANTAAPSPRIVALAGVLALAAAMGIGRFAFTPLLPLMARAGQLDLAWGGWLAAANYAGYFVGALTAARQPLGVRALALLALVLTALSTAAMALPSLPLWLFLRFAAGAASAWVFVATSVWCLGALARAGRPDLGGLVYAGVGGGIALTGLYCVGAAAVDLSPGALWVHLGVLVAVLALPVAWVLARLVPIAVPAKAAPAATTSGDDAFGLVACYGLMGFGYILPATFLPALARTVVDDPRLFGLAWPVFGVTAALSTVFAGWWMRRTSRLQVWAVSQLLMGVGVLLPSLQVAGVTVALSALLVGGTFMIITLAGVQEMRARAAPDGAARLVGRITAAFALGQIAGPVASALLLHTPALAAHGLALALQAGALGLLASGAWLWRRAVPSRKTTKESLHA
jgi:MFS family permease